MEIQRPLPGLVTPVLRLLFLLGVSYQAGVVAADTPCIQNGREESALASISGLSHARCVDATLSCQSYETLEDAVIDAVKRYNPCSIHNDTEFLGAVLYNPDPGKGYIYSIGTGEHGENNISVRVKVPKGYSMVAFWHTHGDSDWSHAFFSATDTALAEKFRLPLYLANYSGTVRVFEPGSTKISRLEARRLGLGNQSGYARGIPVFDRMHF